MNRIKKRFTEIIDSALFGLQCADFLSGEDRDYIDNLVEVRISEHAQKKDEDS